MNIVFWADVNATRNAELNYTNVNYTTAFSGTETMMVEIATAAVARGHKATIVDRRRTRSVDNGVLYTPEMPEQVDVFVPMFFWVHDPELRNVLSTLPRNVIVVPWLQCIMQPAHWDMIMPALVQHPVIVVGPSRFALQQIPDCLTQRHVISNAINPELFTKPDDQKRRDFIFHACLERGVDVAIRVFHKLSQKRQAPANLRIASYVQRSFGDDVKLLGTLSKSQLREHMLQCDYFVYPLVLPSGSVHHDTFGCVVLEALACGVIVVTWDVACIREVYGDHVILLEPPSYDIGSPETPFGHCHHMNDESSVDLFVDAIQKLDADPLKKEDIRRRGIEFAANFSWQQSADKFLKILQDPPFDFDGLRNLMSLPQETVTFLHQIRGEGFTPSVIYDIGSCVLHFADVAQNVWPDATIVLFDGIECLRPHYEKLANPHHIGVLSDSEKYVNFYESTLHPGGNSYYREIGSSESHVHFAQSAGRWVQASSLATVCRRRSFPMPDLIKIDVQGAEHDIIKGGADIIKHAKYLIVEMQHTEYNLGAPRVESTLPYIESLGFECIGMLHNNGPDADYAFQRIV